MLWRGTIDWVWDRGSGKGIAGFLCSLKILTQWHWGLGRGPVWAFMEVNILTGPSPDGDGSTCREDEIPFHNRCTFSSSFSCMRVCPLRSWLIQVHQGFMSRMQCRFAGGIDKNEWDSDECLRSGRPPGNPASGSTPDGPGPIQGRRPTPRFEHEDFTGRNNGFKKTQAWSRCEQSGHNANTCKIELVDRAAWMRQDSRSSRVSRMCHGHIFLFRPIHS